MRQGALAGLAGAAEFIAAGAALTLEIAASRMVAPYLGVTIDTWSAIIVAFLGGLSAGNWLGGRLAGGSARVACRRAALAFLSAAVCTALAPALLQALAAFAVGDALPGRGAGLLLVVPAFLPPGLFVGVLSPILTTLALDAAPRRPGAVVGRMFALGAAGSVIGTLASAFVFLAWVGIAGTIAVLAGACFTLALVFAAVALASGRAREAPG